MKRVLVAGDVMLDKYTFVADNGRSAEAPILCWREIDEPKYFLGGAANVAYHLAQSGMDVSLLGTIGRDDEGVLVENICNENGIQPFLVRVDGRPTTLKHRIMHSHRQLIRIDRESRGAVDDTTIEILTGLLGGIEVDGIVIADHAKGMLVPPLCAKISAMGEGIPIILDPHPNGYRDWEYLTGITPNIGEAELIVGRHDVDYMANALRSIYKTDSVLITMSEKGAYYLDGHTECQIQAPQVVTVDVCGAGDFLVATWMAKILDGLLLLDAAKIAVEKASKSTGIYRFQR